MNKTASGLGFQLTLFAVLIATFIAHEAAHWATALALGHDAFFSLNAAGARGTVDSADSFLISAAGPALTVIQALLAFALVMRRASPLAYAVLYVAAFMRFMATVISLFNPNDEARLSLALGLGAWTLPLVVTGALAILTAIASRRLGVSWKTNLLAYLTATVAVSAIVGLDTLTPR